jgi:hypothetical protein
MIFTFSNASLEEWPAAFKDRSTFSHRLFSPTPQSKMYRAANVKGSVMCRATVPQVLTGPWQNVLYAESYMPYLGMAGPISVLGMAHLG